MVLSSKNNGLGKASRSVSNYGMVVALSCAAVLLLSIPLSAAISDDYASIVTQLSTGAFFLLVLGVACGFVRALDPSTYQSG